jgi:response regulator RpfG family c-di-GMP phosphodiesterase
VYDALVSRRVYKPAWTANEARSHITEQAGRMFDPEVARAFVAMDLSA